MTGIVYYNDGSRDGAGAFGADVWVGNRVKMQQGYEVEWRRSGIAGPVTQALAVRYTEDARDVFLPGALWFRAPHADRDAWCYVVPVGVQWGGQPVRYGDVGYYESQGRWFHICNLCVWPRSETEYL